MCKITKNMPPLCSWGMLNAREAANLSVLRTEAYITRCG